MVSTFRCALEVDLRTAPGIQLATWNQGREIWFQVRTYGARQRVTRLAPDAYFVLRQGDQFRRFYLEADRGTEEHRRIIDKFIGYWWHLQDRPFVDPRGGHLRVNVVFLTAAEERRKNLNELLREMPKPNRATHGGRGVFDFVFEGDYLNGLPGSVLNILRMRTP
jgi:hypothetical protein